MIVSEPGIGFRMKKRMKILLIVSLALNVMFIGIIGGHVAKKWSEHPRHDVVKTFTPETRSLVARTFQSAYQDIQPLGDEARKVRAELLDAVTAEEFNEELFDEIVADMREIQDDIGLIKIEATKTLARELPQSERAKFAERMAKMLGGGFERKVERKRKVRGIKPERKPERPE